MNFCIFSALHSFIVHGENRIEGFFDSGHLHRVFLVVVIEFEKLFNNDPINKTLRVLNPFIDKMDLLRAAVGLRTQSYLLTKIPLFTPKAPFYAVANRTMR